MVSILELLELTIKRHASDLHLTANTPPVLRVQGKLEYTEHKPLSSEELKDMIYDILTDAQKERFEQEKELDLSFSAPEMDRFRVNIHYQRQNVEAAFRRIPKEIPKLEELGLPSILNSFIRKSNGLILITGPTGVGKTTTLAAMVNTINNNERKVIISIEDPIEFVHANKKSIIKQREVFTDTNSFAEALKRALRQDPDVIVVGEMRDLETIATAITAAETGHLVLATLHTANAPQTIQRIIDIFPPYQQKQIRLQLADCLQGIVSQLLLPRADEKGMIVATEVLSATSAIRNLIREGDVAQIPSMIQMGNKYGMHTMDKSLKELYRQQLITKEVALTKVKEGSEFDRL